MTKISYIEGAPIQQPSLPLSLTLGQLLDRQAEEHDQNVALVSAWQDTSLTYQELRSSCRRVAESLLHRGVRPGDHVVVLAGNSVEYAQLFFAVGAIGAIFSIINPTFVQDEVIEAVEFLEPKCIFIAERIGYRRNSGLLSELVKRRGHSTCMVQLATATPAADVQTWDQFLQGHQVNGNCDDLTTKYWATCSPEATVCVQFTSGTTGPRKAAMLSHANLVSNAVLVGQRLGYTPSDVVCSTTPLFHCFALVCGLIATVAHGAAVMLPSDVFLAGATLRALSERRCTVIHSVATMLQAMLDHPDARVHGPQSCLRTGIVAGSALTGALVGRLAGELGLAGLAYGYGMTEASCIVFMTDPAQVRLTDDFSSVGTLLPLSAARVVDEDLKAVPVGSVGELLVSGHSVFQGYYKNPTKTEETVVRDAQGRRWLRTGDLVAVDGAGRCTIAGRVKDMIKRGGENVFPRDVEAVLEQHPDIQTAAVVGIQDAYWGEVVGAFIKRTSAGNLKPGSDSVQCQANLENNNLKRWLRGRIAPHKMPEHFFWVGEGKGVPDELPTNYSGKMMKSELRATATTLLKSRP